MATGNIINCLLSTCMAVYNHWTGLDWTTGLLKFKVQHYNSNYTDKGFFHNKNAMA